MEPENPYYDRNQILEWLHECNKHLSSASAYHAHLNDVKSVQFNNRPCSLALPEQIVSYGYPSDSVSEHLSQSAAAPISSFDTSAVEHPVKQLFQEVNLPLQSSTWKMFYNICKHLHPDMTNRFCEKQIYNGLISAIMKKEVSLKTINTMEGPLRLSDTQNQSFHRAFFECICAARVASEVKRGVNRQCDLTASTAKTSQNVLSSKLASSQTRKKPLPPNYPPSSPNTQQAILIKKPDRLSSSSSSQTSSADTR